MSTITDPLEGPSEVFCERLICVHRRGGDAGWWHVLEDESRLLFAPRKRIIEASLEDVGQEAKHAVKQGLRPVFFVPHPGDWPQVLDAIMPYQDFGAIYIYGRDDEVMRESLHAPSAELLEVYAGEGRILVPELTYGKGLDKILDVDLVDFMPKAEDIESNPLLPRFEFYSRLNPYRHLSVTLDCANGGALLRQHYVAESGQKEEACDIPVAVDERHLEFEGGQLVLTAEDETLVSAVVASLDLPAPYLETGAGDDASWELVPRLTAMAKGVSAYLSRAQQGLLFHVTQVKGGLDKLLQAVAEGSAPAPWLASGAPEPASVRVRGPGKTSQPLPRVTITKLDVTENVLVVHLNWTGNHRPSAPPAVQVEIDGEPVEPPAGTEWNETLSRLVLTGVVLDAPKVAWIWDTETASLRLRFKVNSG